MAMHVESRRVYDLKPGEPGYRVLVDRVWPRGVSRDSLRLDEWCRRIAPSTELRKWFGHDPKRWAEFQARYRRELADQAGELDRLRAIAQKQTLLLLYAARDPEHNQAVVLRDVLAG